MLSQGHLMATFSHKPSNHHSPLFQMLSGIVNTGIHHQLLITIQHDLLFESVGPTLTARIGPYSQSANILLLTSTAICNHILCHLPVQYQ